MSMRGTCRSVRHFPPTSLVGPYDFRDHGIVNGIAELEKAEKLDIYPSVQSRAVPKRALLADSAWAERLLWICLRADHVFIQ